VKKKKNKQTTKALTRYTAWMACADVDMLTTLAVVLIGLRCSSPIVVPASNPKESPVRFFDKKATTSGRGES